MDPVTILSIFSAVVAAVWTAWTWREEHREVRQLQRDQAAALYVNPMLLAAHQMERRLNGILDGSDLAIYKQERHAQDGSASPAAIETLWTVAEYFAWAFVNLRYGPYTRDPKVIEFAVKIARTFDSRDFDSDTFRLSTAEQVSLGQAVLRRVGQATTIQVGEVSSALAEFSVITAFDFERDFRDPHSTRAGLYQSQPIRSAVEAMDRAEQVEQFEGRERLAAVRRLVVPLIDHLERLEGFSVSLNADKKVALEASVAPPPESTAAPRILHRMKGRIRLGIPRLRVDKDYADRLETLVRTWEDVEEVNVNTTAGCVTIRYHTEEADDGFQARILAAIVKASHQNDAELVALGARRQPEGGARPARRRRVAVNRSRRGQAATA
jgi:heavy-metal-associated domain-containing protein